MNSKPTLPEEIEPASGDYSLRADMRVNGWLWIAVLTSFVGEVMLLPHHKDWPIALRVMVALTPLVASLFWVRRVMHWMRGMDELHRRVVMAASLFASAATLFVIAAMYFLVVAGLLPIGFQATPGFGIIWLMVCFYLLGRRIFNRRYE